MIQETIIFFSGYDNNKTVVKEALRSIDDFKVEVEKHNAKMILLDENNYKIDVNKIILKAKLVKNVDAFEPKYLRETQAERNL